KLPARRRELLLHARRQRRLKVLAEEDRLHRRPGGQSRSVACAVERTRADLALEEDEQPESESRQRDEADDRKGRQQARARAPGEGRNPLWSCCRAAGRRLRVPPRQRTPRSF